ncbi:MAG TPA: hypothetical protein ENK91_09320, partial [Bacteroidetes bacterium]|nr:hypothetical protein [Bacteroidota bacterium]
MQSTYKNKHTIVLYFLVAIFIFVNTESFAQQDSCKLEWGINTGGIFDWGTELPFVDMMHTARQWFTKEPDNPDSPWDSQHASELSYREDGYPTHIPQNVGTSDYAQQVATFWVIKS